MSSSAGIPPGAVPADGPGREQRPPPPPPPPGLPEPRAAHRLAAAAAPTLHPGTHYSKSHSYL